jgi:large subunit ribosomal protein L17
MRHGLKIKKIGRNASHRKATLQSMSISLITYKRITTTLGKARALRIFVEPILHRAKDTSTNSRRQAFRRLQSKEAVKTLYGEVASAIADRPGGYTRIVKLGQRDGDAAEMAVVEIVDFNDVKPEGAAQTKRRTRRSRAKAGATGDAAPLAAASKGTPSGPKGDDLTRIFGVGPVFATALRGAGIDTFEKLAGADLDTLRGVIDRGTKTSDEAANEETWATQARLAAAGDWDGLAAFAEEQKAAGGTTHHPSDDFQAEASETGADAPAEPAADAAPADEAPADDAAVDTTGASAPVEEAKAEAVTNDSATPDTTGNPVIPQTPQDSDHPDAEQGAAPLTGEPPPESEPTNRGRSGHRG